MLQKLKLSILLPVLLLISSCGEQLNSGEKPIIESDLPSYDLQKFNELSTFFYIDSIQQNENTLTISCTDTSKFYQPERHAQNYILAFLTVLDYDALPSETDSISFNVSMLYRPDGDISQSYSSKEFITVLSRYNIPIVKEKILALNKCNKQDYFSEEGNKDLDAIYKLNMYFAQIIDPGSWVGVDSYNLIWQYEYNKAGGYDLTSHLDAFNKILTDTLYMEDREMGKAIHEILLK